MGAYTSGKPLASLAVAASMARTVVSCRPDDDVAVAAQRMIDHGVRRLPVVDDHDRLAGIVSLADLARAGARDARIATAAGRVLAGVTKPRITRGSRPERGDVLLAGRVEQEC